MLLEDLSDEKRGLEPEVRIELIESTEERRRLGLRLLRRLDEELSRPCVLDLGIS